MISIRVGSHRFHYRAAGIALDEGCLLLHRLDGDTFWALPGGRVNPGEEAREAIRREFKEELGIAVECDRLVCTGENFFEYDGEPHHEVGLYFSVRLPHGAALLRKEHSHFGTEAGRTLEFRWFPLAELRNLDMRPAVLREALASGQHAQHFVQPPNAA
jgi:ADP-ribose pyrophosphatase YjhB (NUDIX family)